MLGAGDDYVLLFTLPVASIRSLEIWKSQGFDVTVVGEAVVGRGIWLDEGQGLEEVARPAGYQHFQGNNNV
jgi:thiamine-monophosphate kinase